MGSRKAIRIGMSPGLECRSDSELNPSSHELDGLALGNVVSSTPLRYLPGDLEREPLFL
jgi:hypothetical protein